MFWRIPEPSESKIWSWVPWDSDSRMTVLEKASRNLPAKDEKKTDSATNVAPTQRDRLNTYMSRREQKSWSQISTIHEAKNDCAGDTSNNLAGRPADLLTRWEPQVQIKTRNFGTTPWRRARSLLVIRKFLMLRTLISKAYIRTRTTR
jgi:hypothetical protein